MSQPAIDFDIFNAIPDAATGTAQAGTPVPVPEGEAWARAAAAHCGFGASECVVEAGRPVPARDGIRPAA